MAWVRCRSKTVRRLQLKFAAINPDGLTLGVGDLVDSSGFEASLGLKLRWL